MKEPQIDIFTTSVQQFLNQVGWKRKFLRYWGTEMLDGVEVLKEKHYYYPSIANEKLFRHLNMYNQVKSASMSGIDSAWIYLNANKGDLPDLTNELLVQDLDFNVDSGIYTLNISPNVVVKQVIFKGVTEIVDTLDIMSDSYKNEDGSIKVEELSTYIRANYEAILDNYIVEAAEESEIVNLVTMFVLTGSEAFTAEIVNITYTYGESSTTTGGILLIPAISIELKITNVNVVDANDSIIDNIIAYKNKKLAEAKAQELERSNAIAAINAVLNRDTTVTNDIWYKSRLRASMFESSTLKSKDCIQLIKGALDTGYAKKKVPWYKKILGILVFVVVFWISGGTAATSFTAFATAFGTATLAVSLLSAAMAAWGDEVGAGAVGKFAQGVSKIGTFLAIAAVVSNVANAISTALKEAGKGSLLSVLKTKITTYIKDTFRRYTSELTLNNAIDLTNRVFGLYSNNKLESLESKLKEKSNLLQKQEEEMRGENIEETQRLYNLSLMFSKVYTENIKQDTGRFEIDYLYEPTRYPGQKGTMHIGNICRRSFF